MDLDNAEIAFLSNGMFLGVAFENIDTSAQWHPAVSFTHQESGRFAFGGPLDPL